MLCYLRWTPAVRQSDINGEPFIWRRPFSWHVAASFVSSGRVGGGCGKRWSCKSVAKWRAESTCALFLFLKTKYLTWKMWGWKVQFETYRVVKLCSSCTTVLSQLLVWCDWWRHIIDVGQREVPRAVSAGLSVMASRNGLGGDMMTDRQTDRHTAGVISEDGVTDGRAASKRQSVCSRNFFPLLCTYSDFSSDISCNSL